MRDVLGFLVYFSIFVFSFIIAVLFWHVDQHTFRWADIDPTVLFWVHLGNAIFLPIGMSIVLHAIPKVEGIQGVVCVLLVAVGSVFPFP
jgi:hypothetical protein